MDFSSCFKIGFVLKPHGLKGAVALSLDPDAPTDFSDIHSVFLELNNRLVPYFITDISVNGAKAYVKFEDIEDVEAADAISKSSIFLPKTARPKSGRGEFYDDEILGFSVFDASFGELGVIADVMTAGPNRLLVLNHNDKEILIPINSPFITGVNKSKKKVSTELPDGYLDI